MAGTRSALRDLFDNTVTVARQTCTNKSGYAGDRPGYGTPVSYAAKIQRSVDLVRTEHGREVVSRRQVYLYSSTGWSSTTVPRVIDRLTLPHTHSPRQPQIMMVQPVSDEDGIHHIVLWC